MDSASVDHTIVFSQSYDKRYAYVLHLMYRPTTPQTVMLGEIPPSIHHGEARK